MLCVLLCAAGAAPQQPSAVLPPTLTLLPLPLLLLLLLMLLLAATCAFVALALALAARAAAAVALKLTVGRTLARLNAPGLTVSTELPKPLQEAVSVFLATAPLSRALFALHALLSSLVSPVLLWLRLWVRL